MTTPDDELETTWSADAATSTGDTHASDTADADAEDADGQGSADND